MKLSVVFLLIGVSAIYGTVEAQEAQGKQNLDVE